MLVLPRPNVCQHLLDRWHSQIGRRIRHRSRGPRQLGAIGYLTSGPVLDGLMELQNLVLTVLYDRPCSPSGTPHVAGFGADIVPWGIECGGPARSKFFKNLLLQPTRCARGRRIDFASAKLLELALQLDGQVERRARHRHLPIRPQLRLPSFWAGFHKSAATEAAIDGPELERFCRRTSRSVPEALDRVRREHFGLLLYPLEWVSHLLPSAVTVFADIARAQGPNVFRLQCPAKDLVGYLGAIKFDFHATRFDRVFDPASVPASEQKAAS